MQSSIEGKLTALLADPVDTEAKAVYLLCQVRKCPCQAQSMKGCNVGLIRIFSRVTGLLLRRADRMDEQRAIQLCVKHRDPVGFEFLAEKYRREAFGHAFALLGNQDDALDACQDSCFG